MARTLIDLVKVWKSENKVELVLFEGMGKAFCAGGDIMHYLKLMKKKQN
jgi:enoyl-CoA hydratase/carnithine racemase